MSFLRWLAALLFSSHAWRLKHGRVLSSMVTVDGREVNTLGHIDCFKCHRMGVTLVLRNRLQTDLPICGACVVESAPPTAENVIAVRRSRQPKPRRPFDSTTPADTEVSMVQAAPPWED